ncbi:dynein regulation protein LC7 [Kineococcus sp. T13]|uniref:roadblock/LC7 domain-containing protein n=1 Tax=Kineococcus vitellinus TaxID=2696565 RepID=UPI001412115F|nr:dynein regulation protein LC7 [Kineococcus vitellinus]
MTALSSEAADFSWLLDNFVKSVSGVQHTVVVSADGLLMAMSEKLDREAGDQLAAIVSGVSSLARGAARQLQSGEVRQAIIEMDDAFFFLVNISDGSVLAVAAEAGCDVGLIGYEMAMLVQRAETVLTPQLVSEMRAALPTSAPVAARW